MAVGGRLEGERGGRCSLSGPLVGSWAVGPVSTRTDGIPGRCVPEVCLTGGGGAGTPRPRARPQRVLVHSHPGPFRDALAPLGPAGTCSQGHWASLGEGGPGGREGPGHLTAPSRSPALLHHRQGRAERRPACAHPHGRQAAVRRARADRALAGHVSGGWTRAAGPHPPVLHPGRLAGPLWAGGFPSLSSFPHRSGRMEGCLPRTGRTALSERGGGSGAQQGGAGEPAGPSL